jgi:hypothetical protein
VTDELSAPRGADRRRQTPLVGRRVNGVEYVHPAAVGRRFPSLSDVPAKLADPNVTDVVFGGVCAQPRSGSNTITVTGSNKPLNVVLAHSDYPAPNWSTM